MFVWGPLAFENTCAEAWVESLDERRLQAQIQAALRPAELDRPLRLEECVALLCASEILAACGGEPAEPLPDRVRRLLILAMRPAREELVLARAGIGRVREDSSLRAVFEARGDLSAWLLALDSLERRLG
ncbi:MAG: DUF4259 domain-containing protein [Planctomycetes bacterium]|nr:DUF4259 domain-containing protein [Planctomycetota bacterium]